MIIPVYSVVGSSCTFVLSCLLLSRLQSSDAPYSVVGSSCTVCPQLPSFEQAAKFRCPVLSCWFLVHFCPQLPSFEQAAKFRCPAWKKHFPKHHLPCVCFSVALFPPFLLRLHHNCDQRIPHRRLKIPRCLSLLRGSHRHMPLRNRYALSLTNQIPRHPRVRFFFRSMFPFTALLTFFVDFPSLASLRESKISFVRFKTLILTASLASAPIQ